MMEPFWLGVGLGAIAVFGAERFSGANPPAPFCLAAIMIAVTLGNWFVPDVVPGTDIAGRTVQSTDNREGE